MGSQGTAQKTNPIVLLWKMLTQPSNEVVEEQEEKEEKEETILTDTQQSSMTEEQIKELEKSLGRVKILQDKLQIMNFEKTPKVRKAEWNTQGNTRRKREEQTQDNQELSQEKEEEQELS